MAETEKIEYESPAFEERKRMEEAERLHLTPDELARMEQADTEFHRLECLRLAVAWTAPAAGNTRISPEDVGPLFGLANLMSDYIRTGKKPTQTQAVNAFKHFRRS